MMRSAWSDRIGISSSEIIREPRLGQIVHFPAHLRYKDPMVVSALCQRIGLLAVDGRVVIHAKVLVGASLFGSVLTGEHLLCPICAVADRYVSDGSCVVDVFICIRNPFWHII